MKLTNKKMFYLATVIVAASVIASSAIALMTTDTSEKRSDVSATTEQKISYVIGEHQGRVAAFVKGVEVPYIRTDTAVDSLPLDVQESIRAGIDFENEREMREKLLEYCS